MAKPSPRASELIREARLRAGISQQQLAIRAGTGQSEISRLETGKQEPAMSRLRELLLLMGFELRTGLEPVSIASDPRNIVANLALTPSERAEQAFGWSRFAGELRGAGRRHREC